jgi:predicted dehydrogenase
MAGTSPTPVAVAVIGSGFIADYHVNGIRAAGGAEIVVLVSRSAANAARRSAELGIPRWGTDHRQVLADPAIDAVVVATPDDTHAAIAIDALAAGKAVLLQKPMALDAAECRAILAAGKASAAPLTVSFMHRYFPEVAWLKQVLAEGSLGPIHTVRMRNATPGADWNDWFYMADHVAGGVVMQLGVHGIDLIRHLFGPISEVSARMTTALPERRLRDGRLVRSRLEDNVLATYRLPGGVMATHEMSYTEVQGCDRFRLEVYGQKGTAWLRTERGAAALYAPATTGREEWVTPRLPSEPFGAAHHRHWLSIVRGQSPRDDTPEAGLASIEVAEAIYRAANSGCREKPASPDGEERP